jgi:hypothetical protein
MHVGGNFLTIYFALILSLYTSFSTLLHYYSNIVLNIIWHMYFMAAYVPVTVFKNVALSSATSPSGTFTY